MKMRPGELESTTRKLNGQVRWPDEYLDNGETVALSNGDGPGGNQVLEMRDATNSENKSL